MSNSYISSDQGKVLKVLSGPSLSIVLASLGTSTAAVTLPELSESFQDHGVNPALVVSAYILATTAFIVPVGRASDLWGRRTVLVVSLCLYTLGALLAFQAPTLPMLIASRFIQGMGAAGMMAMPLALVRDFIPLSRVGRWMGAMGTMSAIGTASGPAIGGAVVAAFGWRAVYLLQIPVALAALTLCFLYTQNPRHTNEHKEFDLLGASVLAISFAALTFLISDLADGIDLAIAILAVAAGGAFLAFLWIEKRSRSPIIPLGLLRSAHLRVSLVMNAIVSLVMMGILVVGPFFLMDGLELTTAQMGLAMSVGPIVSALSGIPAGRLTERIGAERAVLVGATAMVVATALMAGLPHILGFAGFVLAFVTLSPSYQIFFAALNTSVMTQTSEQDRGVTSGILNLSRNFGFILGAGAVSALFWSMADIEGNAGDTTVQIGAAMAGTFAICSFLSLGVVSLAVVLRRNQNSVPKIENGHS
ncbi:MAG: MFS transporter [Pseudomonadota bacterium]